MSIFVFGGSDRSKQRFFHDLCELRGIRSGSDCEMVRSSCEICNGTKNLLDNAIFSDVSFIVDGKKIYAHRSILYARAEYFRNMFDSKMRECSEKDIVISDVSYVVFKAVLEYLYCGTVQLDSCSLTKDEICKHSDEEEEEYNDEDLNDDDDNHAHAQGQGQKLHYGLNEAGRMSVELLRVADMFRIEGLRNLCVEQVERNVSTENVAFICQVADMHHALNLKHFCINFMMHNFRDVIRSEAFQNLMRQDPGGLGREILEAYSDNNGPNSASGTKRPRK